MAIVLIFQVVFIDIIFPAVRMTILTAPHGRSSDGECIRGKRIGYFGRFEIVPGMSWSGGTGPVSPIVFVFRIIHGCHFTPQDRKDEDSCKSDPSL